MNELGTIQQIEKQMQQPIDALLTLPELAFELDMRPAAVIDLIRAGALPRHSPERKDGQPAWCWRDVQIAIRSHPKSECFPLRLGEIYVVGFDRYVKIGFASPPAKIRISGLQVGAPEELKVYAILAGSRIDERRFHRRFASTRTRGEWFRKEGALLAWIEAGCPADDGIVACPPLHPCDSEVTR